MTDPSLPWPACLPRQGEIIDGKYRVEREIGRGGMAIVFAARHLQIDQLVAMKLLLPDVDSDLRARERFFREITISARLRGEHVAQVFDAGALPWGIPYMIMEYLDGVDLGASFLDGKAMVVAEAVEIVLQACKAVAEAHALGIVHRDIKPSNLFLTRRSDGSRRVVLLDFGISKRAVPAGEGGFAPELTRAQLVAGSPFYMSPEQVRGLAHTDSRTDIWSLGVVLYELLTCRRPFDGEEHGAICAQIAADAPAPPCAYRPDLPTGLDAVVLRCLEKSPERRFSGVDEFMLALLPFGRAGASSVIGTMAQLPGSKTLVLADSRGVMGGTVVDAECSSGGAPATHVAISSTSAAWRAPRIVSFKRASALALVMMTIGVPAFGALVLGSSGPNARAREASVELPAPVPHLPDPGEAPWSGPLPVPDRQTGVALEAATSRREHPPPPKTLRMGDAGRAGAIAGVISTVKAAPRQIEASPQPPPPLPPEPRPDPLSAE